MGDAFTVMGFSFSGTGQNAGIAFPTLKDWSERGKGQAASDVANSVNARFAAIDDGSIMATAAAWAARP
ncbi:hypothetical protein G6F63_016882 [Rhizopus arrhizus]|nr:hypothetical protein G6F63_016882 [Rhizopus arrhizus]